ncbi:MAG: hypothetical protein M3Q07_02440 [Pseudobdellovibrionaceae bacterium]|nr:hypothetical protein [Pseudobdellovibrionaceae bacterium]
MLSLSRRSTCVLLTDHSVKCFYINPGAPASGDWDSGLSAPENTVPLAAGRTAVQVANGELHSCALLDDGSVKCWGAASYGQLGNGAPTGQPSPPEQVINFGPGRKAKAIAVGLFHSCALMDDQTMRCWSRGLEGQLGVGSRDNKMFPPSVPIKFAGNKKVLSIHAAHFRSCAILEDHSTTCWGDGRWFTLGIPSGAVWSPRREPISFRAVAD